MAWIRIDDGAVINQKLGSLSDREYRSLHALWSYCARSKNEGRFTLSDLDFCTFYSARKQCRTGSGDIKKYLEMGLVDALGDGETFQVHDWHDYQPRDDPTAAKRMKRYRENLRKKHERANEP